MNADEISWLLRTIEEPETAKRFVQAQHERGRIRYQTMADLAREHGWTDDPAVQVTAAPISMDYVSV